jgi:predicted dehydrogenase
MTKVEGARPLGDRIDFVSIVTRNDLHYPVAKAFLEAGIHVVCEKPLAFSLAEAQQLKALVTQSGWVFALTHNYTGYPMVKEARAMVKAGKLGRILKSSQNIRKDTQSVRLKNKKSVRFLTGVRILRFLEFLTASVTSVRMRKTLPVISLGWSLRKSQQI